MKKKIFGEISSKKNFWVKFPQKKFCFWKNAYQFFFGGRKKFSGKISSIFFSPQTYFFILYRSVIPWKVNFSGRWFFPWAEKIGVIFPSQNFIISMDEGISTPRSKFHSLNGWEFYLCFLSLSFLRNIFYNLIWWYRYLGLYSYIKMKTIFDE